MSPCPLCLLGYPTPHTKEMWAEFSESETLKLQHKQLLRERRERIEAQIQQVRQSRGEAEEAQGAYRFT